MEAFHQCLLVCQMFLAHAVHRVETLSFLQDPLRKLRGTSWTTWREMATTLQLHRQDVQLLRSKSETSPPSQCCETPARCDAMSICICAVAKCSLQHARTFAHEQKSVAGLDTFVETT